MSFETLEHFEEEKIEMLLSLYEKALTPNGKIIISTPYMQKKDEAAKKLGFHSTFSIDEDRILNWLYKSGFTVENIYYQNYIDHKIEEFCENKGFYCYSSH